jgi:hypothetical protein
MFACKPSDIYPPAADKQVSGEHRVRAQLPVVPKDLTPTVSEFLQGRYKEQIPRGLKPTRDEQAKAECVGTTKVVP